MTITDDEERGGRSDRADYGTDDGDDDEDEERDGRVKNELHAPPKDGDTYLRKTNPDIGVKVYAANHPRLSFDVPLQHHTEATGGVNGRRNTVTALRVGRVGGSESQEQILPLPRNGVLVTQDVVSFLPFYLSQFVLSAVVFRPFFPFVPSFCYFQSCT